MLDNATNPESHFRIVLFIFAIILSEVEKFVKFTGISSSSSLNGAEVVVHIVGPELSESGSCFHCSCFGGSSTRVELDLADTRRCRVALLERPVAC